MPSYISRRLSTIVQTVFATSEKHPLSIFTRLLQCFAHFSGVYDRGTSIFAVRVST